MSPRRRGRVDEADDEDEEVELARDGDGPGARFGHGEPNIVVPWSLATRAAREHALLRVPVRVHAGETSLYRAELRAALAEVNDIWQRQANICFEFEVVLHDGIRADGLDVWLRPAVGPPNGQIRGEPHDIWVADRPALRGDGIEHPAKRPLARTLAHELGHGLEIWHTNREYWGPDRAQYLMSRRTLGVQLARSPFDQVARARDTALAKCVPNFLPTACDEPQLLYDADAIAAAQRTAREQLDAEERRRRRPASFARPRD